MNTSTEVFEPTNDTASDVPPEARPSAASGAGAQALDPEREVEVRRRGEVTGSIGLAGCLVALAWFGRAAASGAILDWALVVAMGAVGVLNLLAFVDARTPVLLADDQGVRVRRGRTWQALTWAQVDRVEIRARRGLVRDGSVDFPAAGGQDGLRVQLSLTTRVVGLDGADLASSLRALVGQAVEVLEVEPAPRRAVDEHADPVVDLDADLDAEVDSGDQPDEQSDDQPDEQSDDHAGDRSGGAPYEGSESSEDSTATQRAVGTGPGEEVQDAELGKDAEDSEGRAGGEDAAASRPVIPAIAARWSRLGNAIALPLRERHESSREDATLGATALRLDPAETEEDRQGLRLPEARELRREGSVDLVEESTVWGDRVRPIARPGDAVAPLVLDDHAPRPVVDPIIGPELAAARTRLGLSVDQLAERTRIRPHVIESIEVDDFAPCGGDFYARGHLRTLARVLGADAAPLLRTYDAQYADAPIDARRVFEAELATGSSGSIRGTRGGPNWSVLVAVVMSIILVWSVARLVVDQPEVAPPSPRLNSSGGVDNGAPATGAAVPVRLTAAGGGAQVIVRSGSQVVFDDQLAFLQTVQLDVAPPVRISSTDGGLTVSIDGQDEGALGQPGEEAQDVFVP